MLLFHIIYTTSINACGLNTLRRARTCQERVCLRMHVHIIAWRDSPNGQIQLSVMIAASLHVNHLSPPHTHTFALSVFIFLFSEYEQYSISPPRPIYLIQSLSCNWNFYWDEGDNSCKCDNWRLAPGRDVKPSKGIKKSKVWNAAHSRVMYHTAPLGHSRLADYGVWLSPPSLLLGAIEEMPHY